VKYLLLKCVIYVWNPSETGKFQIALYPVLCRLCSRTEMWLHRSDYIKSYKQKHNLCSPRWSFKRHLLLCAVRTAYICELSCRVSCNYSAVMPNGRNAETLFWLRQSRVHISLKSSYTTSNCGCWEKGLNNKSLRESAVFVARRWCIQF
jgi:hypothetical protein